MWFLKINSWVNSDLDFTIFFSLYSTIASKRKRERHFETNIVNGDSKNNLGMIQRLQE
jgi:hypothetical protein